MSGRVVHLDCEAPVVLHRSAMSDAQWRYICRKFRITGDESDKIRSIAICSGDFSDKDTLEIAYELRE